MRLDHLLVHTATRAAFAPNTVPADSGAPTFGAQTSLACRIEKRSRLVRARDGSEVVAGHQLVTQTIVSVQDRFWFPSIAGEPADDTAKVDQARTPIAIDVATDLRGVTKLVTVFFA